jgi:hypothetical protein
VGVGVTAGGGVVGAGFVLWAFAEVTNALTATRMLPRRMLDFIRLRLNEKASLHAKKLQGNGLC